MALTHDGQHLDASSPPPITDPLLAWAVATGFRYFGGHPRRIPLLVESHKTGPRVVAERFKATDSREALIEVPQMFLAPPGGIEDMPYFCLLLNGDRDLRAQVFAALAQLEEEGLRYEFGLPLPADAFDASFAEPGPASGTHYGPLGPPAVFRSQKKPPPAAAGTVDNVVMAVVDDSIAFAHERFRKAGNANTRIEHLWVQDMGAGGTEFDSASIDSALAMCTHAGLVDESEVYRVTGVEDFAMPNHKGISRNVAHGTHVLDIAAGYDPRSSPPTNRPIIAVQFPDRVVRDTGGAYLTYYGFVGIFYVLLRAIPLGKPGHAPPVVINLSYDRFTGPHDGTSVFEKAVDWLLGVWYPQFKGHASVVLPSGNNFLWRTHAHIDSLATGGRTALSWRQVPDSRTPSLVQVWLDTPPPQTSDVRVKVTSPDGVTSGWMKLGDPAFRHPPSTPFAATQLLWKVTYDSAAATSSRPRITIITAPTGPYDVFDPTEEVVPSGVWTIELQNQGGQATVDAWIRRNDTPFGWPVLGRQSYFDDSAYDRFDSRGRYVEVDNASYVKRFGTVSGLATGNRTVVAAGFRQSDGAMARYSAAGPLVSRPVTSVPIPRVGYDPDAAAVSDEFVEIRGVLAAGARSNAAGAMNGTSVAAPQVARYIASRFEKGKFNARYEVEVHAIAREAARPPPPPPLPVLDRMGHGRIDDQIPPRRYVR